MIKIEIDRSKCTTPFDCKKCLQVCPQAVFMVLAVKVEKFKETDPKEPGSYLLWAHYIDKCSGCEECVRVCPEGAINLVLQEGSSG